MKINIKNKRAADFHTIVLYSDPYLPTPDEWTGGGSYTQFFRDKLNSPVRVSDKVLYKYNSTKISETDFTEYDFKFFPEKFKYNDIPKIEYLRKEDKELLGPKYQDLYILEESLFPTITTENSEESKIGYFSSYIVGPQEIYILNLPKSISRVEFYENSLESNIKDHYFNYSSEDVSVSSYTFINNYDLLVTLNQSNSNQVIEPDLVVTLGPEFGNVYNNLKVSDSTWFYQDTGLNWEVSGEESTELFRNWVTLKDEKDQRKILYFVISHDISSQGQLNLSYSAWLESINSNRNKWSYSLRNDESGKSVSPIYKNSLGFLYDGTSGTLVGTSSISELDSSKASSIWSPKRKYWKGDVAIINNSSYVSTSDGNLGNHPYYSGKWIKQEYLDNEIIAISVQVVVPLVGEFVPGEVIPSGLINLPRYTNNYRKLFNYSSNPGYELDTLSSKVDEVDLVEGEDYSKQVILNENGVLTYRVTVTNWTKSKSSGYLYFNYKTTPGKLICKQSYFDGVFGDSDFSDFLKDHTLDWTVIPGVIIKVNGEDYNPSEGIELGSSISIKVPKQSNYIVKAGIIYQSSSNELVYSSRDLTEEGNYYILNDTYNYSTISYENNIIYPQYSFIFANNYVTVSYITKSSKIFYQDPIQYMFTNRVMNYFKYTGDKTTLSIKIISGGSTISDEFQTKDNWSSDSDRILYRGVSRDDYQITISPRNSNITIIIDEI